jgi:hypothetical protein
MFIFSLIAVAEEPETANVSTDMTLPGAILGVAGTEARRRLRLNEGRGWSSCAKPQCYQPAISFPTVRTYVCSRVCQVAKLVNIRSNRRLQFGLFGYQWT